jgi:hypothetical protein
MGVKLQSALGGSVELNAPSTASNFTMTVPAGNGTVATTDQLTTFRNRIINGDMRIDQRNAGASVSVTGTTGYVLDRWASGASQDSKYSIRQNSAGATPPAGFTNYLGITSLSSYSVLSSDTFLIRHNIEGFNTSDLDWGKTSAAIVTLSFWAQSSLTGTFGGALINAGATRSYPFNYTISSANTWEYKTIIIPGDTTGTWLTNNGTGIEIRFGLGSGSTYTGTAGTWIAGNVVQPTGTVSVVGTNAATFFITGVQLEKGSVATPFERRPYGTEFSLCQRYYQRLGRASYATVGAGRQLTTIRSFIYVKLTTTMRAAPSVAVSGLIVTERASFDAAVTSISGSAIGPDSLHLDVNHAEAGAIGQMVFLSVTGAGGEANGVILSAEL